MIFKKECTLNNQEGKETTATKLWILENKWTGSNQVLRRLNPELLVEETRSFRIYTAEPPKGQELVASSTSGSRG